MLQAVVIKLSKFAVIRHKIEMIYGRRPEFASKIGAINARLIAIARFPPFVPHERVEYTPSELGDRRYTLYAIPRAL